MEEKVSNRALHGFRVLCELTETAIALEAQESADVASLVIVIDVDRCARSADRAQPALMLAHAR
jgi:hypothetical protein